MAVCFCLGKQNTISTKNENVYFVEIEYHLCDFDTFKKQLIPENEYEILSV